MSGYIPIVFSCRTQRLFWGLLENGKLFCKASADCFFSNCMNTILPIFSASLSIIIHFNLYKAAECEIICCNNTLLKSPQRFNPFHKAFCSWCFRPSFLWIFLWSVILLILYWNFSSQSVLCLFILFILWRIFQNGRTWTRGGGGLNKGLKCSSVNWETASSILYQ